MPITQYVNRRYLSEIASRVNDRVQHIILQYRGDLDAQLLELSDYIIIKASSNVFQSQDLNNILAKHQVDEVIITGFNAEYCCLFIAVVGIDRGYKITYIEDATASVNNGDTYEMLGLDIVDFVGCILD
ncbi:isochorismatase family protein [Streptococcus sp.]|uniref:isochorismatase family protein n=1 Tax=Streptococcus sp. TaxID=1306 RepID=UPI001CAF2E3E|nr:isochorismatase family protein [Streptococcus sp.]MBF1722282.1 cysteine hydrolase [Streptococcus sp.]